jgi:putative acyl-CoA dehydrogenase
MPNSDGSWSLVGHKWFFSVPHSDVFLTLAQTPEGISCFVVAGWLPDGSRNRLQIQRLKDKCGNKSNASSEVEFRGAVAHLIGEPGHGIRTGISMNHFTRLDFAVGSSGLMRQAVAQAATMLVVAFRTESGRGQRLLTLLGRADTAPRRVTIWPTPQTAAEPF